MKKITTALLAILPGALLAAPSLTIYNNDFAVVRDSVRLEMQAGENAITATNITARAEPKSVVLSDPSGKNNFQVIEQSYRADAVSVGLLLDFFEGKTIDFLQPADQNGKQETIQGKIVRSGFARVGRSTQPIIEVDGALRFGLPGQPLFPTLGEDSVLKPTLTWTIDSEAAVDFDARLSYLTGGLSWAADYNLVLPAEGDVMQVMGWVSFDNNSGKTFENAQIKLLAGDVRKFANNSAEAYEDSFAPSASRMMKRQRTVTEKKLDEYHLYTLGRPTTLRDQQTKQVEFVSSDKVESKKILIYNGTNTRFYGGRNSNSNFGKNGQSKIEQYREFKNTKENGLGIPLPKGRLRFYRVDGDDDSLQFIGEAEIDHTPKDEKVRVKLGNAFDLVGERKQTDFEYNSSSNWIRESFEIELRNRGDKTETINVVEYLYRWSSWKIEKSDFDWKKTHSDRIEADIVVAAGETKKLIYTVFYSW